MASDQRKPVVYFAFLTALILPQMALAAFNPKASEVCVASGINRNISMINRRKIVGLLIEKQVGLHDLDLDIGGGDITYAIKVKAILDAGYCGPGNKCSDGTKDKLGSANIILAAFLVKHSHSEGANSKDEYIITTEGGMAATPVQFLGAAKNIVVSCNVSKAVAPTAPSQSLPGDAGKDNDAASGAPDTPAAFFAVRANPEDLRYPQSGKDFKSLQSANLAFGDDNIKHTLSAAVNGVVGYSIAETPLGGSLYGEAASFFSYNQNYVSSADITKSSRVFNIGGGFIGDIRYRMFGFYQDIQFYPKIVHSLSTEATIVSGNAVYTPEPTLSGIGQDFYVSNFLSVQFMPQAKFAYNQITARGTDLSLLGSKQDYVRLGPSIGFVAYGEEALSGFSVNLSYEYYRLFRGPIAQFDRFQSSLNYALGNLNFYSIQLKYLRGRDLDTLQPQDQITLGLGLKY